MKNSIKVKILRLVEFVKKASNDDAVFIYQMGKVGSTALERGIAGSVHFHTLYGNGPCNVENIVKYGGIKGWVMRHGQCLVRRVAIKLRREVKIITVVRSPVERNISMFFQDLSFWILGYSLKIDPEMRTADMNWLRTVYQRSFDHDYCDRWFDREIKRLTGIDVFKENFDLDSGASVYRRGKYAVLLLRSEDIKKNKKQIEQFVGESIALESHNSADNKWYGCVYEEFKGALDFEHECIKSVAAGRVAKKFGYYVAR